MKKLNLIIVFFIVTNILFAQEEKWLWADGGSGNNVEDFFVDTKTDSQGNIYVAGRYVGTEVTFGAYTINAPGDGSDWNCYLVKYNSQGEVQWAQGYGSAVESDEITKIVMDSEDNIYIYGDFSAEQLTIGTITLNINTESTGDIFIAKLNGDGNTIWANNYGNTESSNSSIRNCDAGGLAIDTEGNIYISGEFRAPVINFGSISLENSDGSNLMDNDAFFAKFDPEGNILWADNPKSISMDYQKEYSRNITTDLQNNLIVNGNFWGESASLTFAETTEITGNDDINYFIAKYNTNGEFLWVKTGSSDDNTCETKGGTLVTDDNGNIYSHILFDGEDYNFLGKNITSSCNGEALNTFVVKLTPEGEYLWLNHFNSKSSLGIIISNYWTSATVTPLNELILGGVFADETLTIGDITLINTTSSPSYYTPFLVKFDENGTALWAETTQNVFFAGIISIDIDNNNDLIVVGNHAQNSIFFDEHEQTNSGQWDGFIAKKTGIIFTENYQNDILAFTLPEQTEDATINTDNHTVEIEVETGTDVSALTPIITISEDATITPESGIVQDFTAPFEYTVTAENEDEQIWIVTVDIATGINEIKTQISIYPNPSTGTFYLNLEASAKPSSVTITDLTGKTILTVEAQEHAPVPLQIDISNQPKGIFFIKIITETGFYIEKIIIQ